MSNLAYSGDQACHVRWTRSNICLPGRIFIRPGREDRGYIWSTNLALISTFINYYTVDIIFRRKRMAEMREAAQKAKYGSVLEITKEDWVREVNKAGDGIWVVLHVYKQGYNIIF